MRVFFLLLVVLMLGIGIGGIFFGYYREFAIDYTMKIGGEPL